VITDIRRVIYGLRPPALDELGFAEALRVQASVFRTENLQIELQMPQTLPALTAAEEVAAYRIVLEALSNVSNHSDATICAVRCEARADGLHVSVDDNGTIKVSEIRSGVGISSMRELASELGGKCELQPSPLGGLRVCAWLPQRSPGRTL
jgi:signal transduction histidine kinase